jgi:hypothetical protein
MVYTLHIIEPHINIYSLCCHVPPILCNSSQNSHCDRCFVIMQFHRSILQEGCWYKTLETTFRWLVYGLNENLCGWSLNYELKVIVQKSKRLQSNVGYPKHRIGMHLGLQLAYIVRLQVSIQLITCVSEQKFIVSRLQKAQFFRNTKQLPTEVSGATWVCGVLLLTCYIAI